MGDRGVRRGRLGVGDVPFWANGPYKLDRWEHDVIVEMSPNPGHWNFFENLNVKKAYDPIIPADAAVSDLRARRR